MKVDKNQLVPNVELYSDESQIGFFGIPLRLEIAARLLAASISRNGFAQSDQREATQMNEALRAADKLIEAHNETCEDQHEITERIPDDR